MRQYTDEERKVIYDMTFLDELELAECFGYEFMSDKIKHNYVESLKHYLRHYKPVEGDVKIEVEKEFYESSDYTLEEKDYILFNIR